jgi:phosphoglycolate phosphatase-like HAD superfamily hydrolase
MSSHEDGGAQADAPRALEEMRRSNSEAFSILGTELAEVKAMLMVLLDLQKSVIYSTGMSEADVERHVQTLLEGYRERFLSVMSERIRSAAGRAETS